MKIVYPSPNQVSLTHNLAIKCGGRGLVGHTKFAINFDFKVERQIDAGGAREEAS